MIQRLDIDLASDAPVRLGPGQRAWVLVRFEGHVLGEADVRSSDLAPAQGLRDLLMRRFAAEVFWASRSNMTANRLPDRGAASDVTIVVETGGHPAPRVRASMLALDALEPRPVEVLLTGQDMQGRPDLDALLLAARNESVRAARGSIVVFISPGSVPHPGYLQAVTRPFSLPGMGAVIPLFTPHELETPAQAAFDRRFLPPRRFERRIWSRVSEAHFDPIAAHPGVVGGIAYRRRALEEVGGFAATDRVTVRRSELQTLAKFVRAGWALQSEPDAEIRHLHPRARADARHWLTVLASDRADFRRSLPKEPRSTMARYLTKIVRLAAGGDLDAHRRLTVAGASARAMISSSLRGSR